MVANAQPLTNRFHILIELQKQKFLNNLVASGVVSLKYSNWLDIYKHYLEECKENQKPIAIQFTSDYWKISERNLYRIINFMEDQF